MIASSIQKKEDHLSQKPISYKKIINKRKLPEKVWNAAAAAAADAVIYYSNARFSSGNLIAIW